MSDANKAACAACGHRRAGHSSVPFDTKWCHITGCDCRGFVNPGPAMDATTAETPEISQSATTSSQVSSSALAYRMSDGAELHLSNMLSSPDDYSPGRFYTEMARTIVALRSALQEARDERDEARRFGNRWMKAAMYAVPVSTLAFDPTNPEAFAESRRALVDGLIAKAERIAATPRVESET